MRQSSRTARKLAIASFTAIASTVLLPAAAGAAGFSMTASPALRIPFTAAGLDYAAACTGGTLTLNLNTPSTSKAKVDGKSVRSGKTSTKVKLTPGQRTRVAVTDSKRKTTEYSVRCVPADFPYFVSSGKMPAPAPFAAISGVTVGATLNPYAIVIDSRGVPVWWKHLTGNQAMDVKPIGTSKIGFWNGVLDSDHAGAPFDIYNLNGSLAKEVNTVGGRGDAHETLENADGSYYRIAGQDREGVDLTDAGVNLTHAVVDNEIQKIESDGSVSWSWNSKDHLALAESRGWAPLAYMVSPTLPTDHIHMNSIADDGNGGLVVSARHLDAVFRIRKSDGSIDWKLGGTTTDKSLTVVGDDSHAAQHLSGQHDARVQPDGTITVYDNGSSAARAPRVLRFQINAAARTATLVETLTDPAMTSSAAGGGARKLSDGSWLVSWSHLPWVRGYDAAHKMVFDLKFSGNARSYRVAPISGSGFTRAAFTAGMDVQYPR